MSSITPHTKFFGNLCNADYKLEEIRAFHDEIEKLIITENKKLEVQKIEYEENPELYGKKFHFGFTLSRNLRNSIIISLITFLEIELQNFCAELKRSLKLSVSHNEFKGTIFEQFKIYSNKLAFLGLDFQSQNWQSVKELVELRNCIVHYDGFIEDWYGRKFSRAQLIENLIKKYSFVQIKDNDLIELDEDACEQCIAIIKEFTDIIYNQALLKFPKEN